MLKVLGKYFGSVLKMFLYVFCKNWSIIEYLADFLYEYLLVFVFQAF